jgi:lysophospholipase L1-like esterase
LRTGRRARYDPAMRTALLPPLLVLFSVACGTTPPDAPPPATVIPVPRERAGWHERFAAQLAAARAGGHRVVFVGDSITEGWEGAGKASWQEVFAPRRALNLGISGDRTQHVLWRLDHGLLEALAAANNNVRACVVMIGTNNSNGTDHTAEEIAAGVVAVVRRLRDRLPKAQVLLLAIFPRGEQPNAQRDKNTKASALAAAELAGDAMVVPRDLADRFLAADGTLPEAAMPDALHLSSDAYRTWADAIVGDVDAMLR